MSVVRTILLAAFCFLVAGYTIRYFYLFFQETEKFYSTVTESTYKFRERTILQKIDRVAHVIIPFGGVGIVLYRASLLALAWVPTSWGGYSEDGDWEWAAEGWSMLAAFIGASLLCGKMRDMAGKIIRLEEQSKPKTPVEFEPTPKPAEYV